MEYNPKIYSLIQNLERGKESFHQIINMLQNVQGSSSSSLLDHHQNLNDDNQGNNISYLKLVDDHFKVVKTSFDDALFMLRSFDFIDDVINMRRPNVGCTDMNDSPNHLCKIEDKFGGEIPKHLTPSKDRRGSYKRRRNGEKIMETMNLLDDGHGWRKYGQKNILNFTHPRNYYRCTHKSEGCEATKQVQQISDYPQKYKITYHGHHTCKAANTSNNNNPIILFDSIDDNNQNSSKLLSFDKGKQALISYPSMFPPPATASSSTPSSASSSGVALLTGSSIKEEGFIPSEPLNKLGGTLYVETPSPDVTAGTAITAVSDNLADVISSTDLYSSVSNVHGVLIDECFSSIFADDFINLDDLYSHPP